jgi:hypothetical protein
MKDLLNLFNASLKANCLDYNIFIADEIKKEAIRQMDELKYVPRNFTEGLLATVFDNVGIQRTNPIPQHYFHAFEDAIYESFYGGCEPEFETEDEYNRFQEVISELNSDHYKFVLDKDKNWINQRSPYTDKTVPYLKYFK